MRLQSRHRGSRLREVVDLVSCLLCLPSSYCLDYGLARYYLTTGEQEASTSLAKLRDRLLLGPLLLALALLFLPIAIHGWVLWVLLCHLLPSRPYSLLTLGSPSPTPSHQTVFTFVSCNALLGPEMINKFNNLGDGVTRLRGIAANILRQTENSLENVKGNLGSVARQEAVLSRFPHVDFLCFQEVFSRTHSVLLASLLAPLYPHTVLDVGKHSLGTNLCLLGSGLMVASRFPITSAEFLPWRDKRRWHYCLGQGLLVCKVDLGEGRVGVLATLHMVAYQGRHQLIRGALDQVTEEVRRFREREVAEDEVLEWEVVAGDWNVDNLSPGDRGCAEHEVFREFSDPATVAAGEDQGWSVGTETRQATLHRPEMRDPETFREILIDDVRRRHYINDADVEEHSFELMTSKPRPNATGEVVAKVWGGQRRIDRVVHRGGEVVGVATVTALAGLTDHAPVLVVIGKAKLSDTSN